MTNVLLNRHNQSAENIEIRVPKIFYAENIDVLQNIANRYGSVVVMVKRTEKLPNQPHLII